MAGVNEAQVYLPSPDQSAVTGAVYVAETTVAAPSDASTTLPASNWESGGYIDPNGIALAVSKSYTTIKDWGQNNVRKALSEYDGTIALTFLQVDEFAMKQVFGEGNVTVNEATTTKGNRLKVAIGPDTPAIKSWCFNMKDEDRRVRVYVPKGQITEVTGDVTFTPGAANSYPCRLSTYDDGTGHSIYVMYDDGQVTG